MRKRHFYTKSIFELFVSSEIPTPKSLEMHVFLVFLYGSFAPFVPWKNSLSITDLKFFFFKKLKGKYQFDKGRCPAPFIILHQSRNVTSKRCDARATYHVPASVETTSFMPNTDKSTWNWYKWSLALLCVHFVIFFVAISSYRRAPRFTFFLAPPPPRAYTWLCSRYRRGWGGGGYYAPGKQKEGCQQHLVFPGGRPSKY